MESTTLFFKEGSSDKVYQAFLEPHDGAWIVCFAFGRRGTLLTNAIKTPEPISYEKALGIYRKLISAKMAKGYIQGESGASYHGGSGDTGVRPQLLNPATERGVEVLLNDDDFLLQPKPDGRRLLIRKQGRRSWASIEKGFAAGFLTSCVSVLWLSGMTSSLTGRGSESLCTFSMFWSGRAKTCERRLFEGGS